jgi:2-iminobutanoate/2-iminopropanoate deaminase
MNRKVVPHRDVPGAPVGAALVSAAGLAWVNGVLPLDLENPGKALAESVEEQSRQIMRNLDQLLSAQGLSRQQVVAVTVHLRQMNRFGVRFEKVYAGFFEAPHLPTRSWVGVSELPREALVAMDFVVHAG